MGSLVDAGAFLWVMLGAKELSNRTPCSAFRMSYLEEATVLPLHRLPQLHEDPFDRKLVYQAIERVLVILSPDPLISQYPTRTAW